jgi:photosystem II stability/assembly factor-like uncharacterized protein
MQKILSFLLKGTLGLTLFFLTIDSIASHFEKGLDNSVLRSQDGLNWTPTPTGSALPLLSIMFDGQQFLAVGGDFINQGILLRSTDGLHWEGGPIAPSTTLASLIYSPELKQYVAVGYNGTILISKDSIKWASVEEHNTVDDLRAVTYGNGLYVAVGGTLSYHGLILTSTDGLSWQRQPSPDDEPLWDVAYNAAKKEYVAVGENGLIAVSPDGNTWHKTETPIDSPLMGVVYGAGQYVAVGFNGIILTSPDAKQWSQVNTGISSYLLKVRYNPKLHQYIALGEGGVMLNSNDGASWRLVTTPLKKTLWDISYGAEQYVAVGQT